MRFSDTLRSPSLRHLAVVLAGLVVAFLLLGVVLRPTRAVDVLDGRTLAAAAPATGNDRGTLWWFVQLGNPSSYAQFCLALVLTAALRRRWRLALLIPPTMLLSELTAQHLKVVLAEARDVPVAAASISDASWPSGHSTAVMTVALLAILVAPRRLRPLVAAVGALTASAVGIGLIAERYHYPSDVFGGFLCAAIFVTIAAIVLTAWDRRRPRPRPVDRRPLRPVHVAGPALLLVLGFLTAVAVAARADGGIVAAVGQHTAAVAVLGALGALALTLVAAATALTAESEEEAERVASAAPSPRWRPRRSRPARPAD
ncbi:Phosphoesterase PA-phosphatase related protein [Patulibacter medicamentivorans]|uniref:Phosphoesterase PA-phosphatase related protein n=1 Tax=Patulibacter medicamentivorans TaxID=1097667 RepID=H0E2Z8_9ACTN|nr:phosphatase PAP2 family protein [Patulibacter medicamentivorans]EHN11946.1 Phosphoesterase PA-phosphatase related protein [Patulibacter medicamentivorans]